MSYSAIVFDCDGVLLDSNKLKSDAMAETVKDYDSALGDIFVEYHRKHGGISRYKKFDYFLRTLVGNYTETEYNKLLSTFSTIVKQKLLDIPLTNGALDLIEACCQTSKIYIVSGGDQQELCEVFEQRQLSKYFTAIYGSPIGKHQHCANILNQLDTDSSIVFFGDAVQDYLAARDNGMDFIFISGYTDMKDWQSWCKGEEIVNFPDLYTVHQYFRL